MPLVVSSEPVSIGTWVFGTPACTVTNVHVVRTKPTIRSNLQPIPDAAGESAGKALPGAIRFAMEVLLHGDRDVDGNVVADARQGLGDLEDAMEAAILPPATAPFTRTIVDTARSREAQCQVLNISEPTRISTVTQHYVIQVVIPSGTWAAV